MKSSVAVKSLKSKTKFAVVSLACVSCMATSGVLAAYDSTASVQNNLSMDTVDIELSEYSIINETEVPYQNIYTDLTPGAVISKIPRITNKGADCYVRAKIELTTYPAEGQTETVELTMDEIKGIDTTKWTLKEDGYYYYNGIMKVSDKVDLFTEVDIPTSWTTPNENCKCEIDITAEAVQSEHFTPDMSSDTPWGDTEIEVCERTRDFRKLSEGANSNFVMSYGKGTQDLIVNRKDLFENFKSMVPGDVVSDYLDIENSSDDDVELFFSTSFLDGFELDQDRELLDKIGLVIEVTNSETTKKIYEGSLTAESLREFQSIGYFYSGDKGKLTFTLSVPETLKNEFNMTQTKVQWNFGLEKLGTGVPTPGNPGKTTQDVNNPKTGEMTRKIASGALAAASLGLLMSLSKIKKKAKAEENAAEDVTERK